MERKLAAILQLLVSLHVLPSGDVLDAGANDGRSARVLAGMFKGATVLAIDPLEVNVRHIRRTCPSSVQALRGKLGRTNGTDTYHANAERKVGSQIGRLAIWKRNAVNGTVRVPVFAVDELFRARSLAFAHWDVEGDELNVLHGASQTIARDRPFFTVETHAAHYPAAHKSLLESVRALGYRIFTVPEQCGWPDCRNHVCIPQERMKDEVVRAVSELAEVRAP